MKLDAPEPYTRSRKYNVNNWLNRMDLDFLTKIRLPTQQHAPRVILLSEYATKKWLRAELRLSNKIISDLTWPLLHEELCQAFRPPDYKFAAFARLSKVKNHRTMGGCTASFYNIYYHCTDLSKSNTIW